MIASSPSTPVVATAWGSVPLYDVTVIPTLQGFQSGDGTYSSEFWPAYDRARPFSQSMTALGASVSFRPPDVGHPSESPVPGDSEWTTAYPRGIQVDS